MADNELADASEFLEEANEMFSGIPAGPATDQGGYKPWLPMGQEQDLGMMNSLRMIGNAPGSAYQRLVKDPLSLTTQLGPMAMMLGRGIAGSGAEFGRKYMGYADHPNAKIFRDMMSGLAEGWSTKTMIEDPIGYLMNFSGAGSAAGRVGRMQSILKASQTSPWQALPGALKASGKVQRVATQKALPEMLGFTTGREPEAFRQATEATSRGAKHAEAFWQGLRGEVGGRPLHAEIQSAKNLLTERRSKVYRENLAKITKVGDADLGAVKTRLLESLKEMGVTPKYADDGSFLRNKQGQIELSSDIVKDGVVVGGSAIEGAGEIGNIQRLATRVLGWEDNSLHGMDALKQRVYKIMPRRGDIHPRAKKLGEGAYHDLRKELGDKYEGYNKLADVHQHYSEILGDFGTALSGNANNPEALLNKISKAMHSDHDIRTGVIEMLEDVSGVPIRAQLAGSELQKVAPSGLIGRAAAAGTITAGVALQKALKALPFLLVTSPKVMGSFYGALGYGRKIVDDVEKFMANLHNKLPEGMMTEGMTIGGILKQIEERGGLDASTMGDDLMQGSQELGETVPERLKTYGGAVRGGMREKFYGRPEPER